ncbi:MAG: hypothetical protein HOP02_12895 [Methylococcaceae bacterium]|nr:hypothetical protein [Methylococcaceae bacterium]
MKKLPTPMKFFGLLMLGFMSDSYAIDNYDPATQTLTIPQVLVGNTTYNNVVLSLRDFGLVKIDANPSVGIVHSGFLMQFVSAKLQGGQAKITLNLTSQGKDLAVEVGDDGTLAKARFTDENGNIYDPVTVQIRNKTHDKYINYQFDADIPSTVVLTYDNVPSNTKSISLFDMKLFYSDAKFSFGNIPFQTVDAATPF